MKFVDANILLYAEDENSPSHEKACAWWDAQLSGSAPVCLSWAVIGAFILIGTNPRLFARPLTMNQAVARIQSWLDQPCVRLIRETDRHWIVFQEMLAGSGATGNLVTDAHLAAIAIEHNCELNSCDSDFARFPKLKWRNPLA